MGLILATADLSPAADLAPRRRRVPWSGSSLSAQYPVGRRPAASDGGVAAGRRDQQLRVLGARPAVVEGGAVRRPVRQAAPTNSPPTARGSGGRCWPATSLALLLAAGAAIATFGGRAKAFDGAPVGLFALILLVTAMTALVSDLLPRHMVAVTPAAAALVGLAAERAGGRPEPAGAGRPGRRRSPLRLVRAAAAGGRHRRVRPGSVSSRFGGGAERDRRRPQAGLLRRPRRLRSPCRRVPPGRARTVGAWSPTAHMSFLYETFPATNARANRDELPGGRRQDGRRRRSARRADRVAVIGRAGRDFSASRRPRVAHFLYFPYTTRDGNCLKTFPNGYIPTAFEAAHLAADAPAAAKVGDGEAVFAASQPGRRDRHRRRNPPRGLRLCRDAARPSAAWLYRAVFPLDRRPRAVLCRRAGGPSGPLRRRHRRIAAAGRPGSLALAHIPAAGWALPGVADRLRRTGSRSPSATCSASCRFRPWRRRRRRRVPQSRRRRSASATTDPLFQREIADEDAEAQPPVAKDGQPADSLAVGDGGDLRHS